MALTKDPIPRPLADKCTAPASKADEVAAFAACSPIVQSINTAATRCTGQVSVLRRQRLFLPKICPGTCVFGRRLRSRCSLVPWCCGAGSAIEHSAVLAELLSTAAVVAGPGVLPAILKSYIGLGALVGGKKSYGGEDISRTRRECWPRPEKSAPRRSSGRRGRFGTMMWIKWSLRRRKYIC